MLKVPGLTKTILAVGGELNNTFAINRGENVFIGPHTGDLKNSETFDFFKHTIAEFQRMFKLVPEVVACDSHPLYMSARFAKENFTGIPVVEVQHHHAHLVSTLVENGLPGPAIGISMDGTGFGTDGAIWGCEAGIVSKKDFLRRGHLDYFYLPGGDKCADEVYRCALAFLYGLNREIDLKSFGFLSSISEDQVKNLYKMMDKKINVYSTSSMGRFFDGVSS
ncbi:MAG: carbamoyltransferase HypF, partial [Ruminiclostridium sp.]|nr:carbamoyltransferase HypF [Ruminiclostridium sp.]